MLIIHFVAPADIDKLSHIFTYPTEGQPGEMIWVEPEWLKMMRASVFNEPSMEVS